MLPTRAIFVTRNNPEACPKCVSSTGAILKAVPSKVWATGVMFCRQEQPWRLSQLCFVDRSNGDRSCWETVRELAELPGGCPGTAGRLPGSCQEPGQLSGACLGGLEIEHLGRNDVLEFSLQEAPRAPRGPKSPKSPKRPRTLRSPERQHCYPWRGPRGPKRPQDDPNAPKLRTEILILISSDQK